MLFLLPMAATAAEVTRMPAGLEGEVTVRYHGSTAFDGLTEGSDLIAKRRFLAHHADVGIALSPVDGFALTVGLATTPTWSLRFPSARTMVREPVEGGGSYAFGEDTTDTPSIRGGGIQGMWFGVDASPFSETFDNAQAFTWKISAAFRTGSKTSRWTVNEGKRGASPGGTALRLSGAFSRRGGLAEPYIKASWQRESKVLTDIVDAAGTVWAAGLELRPASHVEMLGGTEIFAAENSGSNTTVDVFVGFGYRSWEDIPSGLLLPNVIDASRGIAVTHSESLFGLAGLGLNIQYSKHLRSSAGARVNYVLPHTQEHVYDVQTTPDSYGIGWYLSLTGNLGVDDF